MSEPRSVKLALSIFTNITESLALPAAFSRSPRNCQQQSLVGLGIVAAMIDAPEQGEARIAISPRSSPIPILSARPGGAKFRGPTSTIATASAASDDDPAASEGYTCVISRHGDGAGERKREYFDRPGGAGGDWSEKSGLFWASPTPEPAGGDGFLSACYLCRKRLHGLDIFMYRGEKAFCSVECRYQQILSDELKENCGSLKSPFDCAASPCSVPRLFSAGVAAA